MSNTNFTLDLTQRPPRSPRVRLGGFVFFADEVKKFNPAREDINTWFDRFGWLITRRTHQAGELQSTEGINQ